MIPKGSFIEVNDDFKFHYYDLYSLYQMSRILKELDFALLKLLNDLKEH